MDLLPYRQTTDNIEEYKICPKLVDMYKRKVQNSVYEIMLFYKKTHSKNEIKKITEQNKKKIELCVKKEILNFTNELIDLFNQNPNLESLLKLYFEIYDSYQKCPASDKSKRDLLREDYKKLFIGFDEILLYKYFQQIIVFNQNQRQIKKLSILNSLSFSFPYIEALAKIKSKCFSLYNVLDSTYKKIVDDISTEYERIPLINYKMHKPKHYNEMINLQKKILKDKTDTMIMYDSTIDIIPFYHDVIIKYYPAFGPEFKSIYKLLTDTDFVDTVGQREKLVYDISGGANYNNDATQKMYYSKYLKYKKKYIDMQKQ
jgi:hypothetical protein